MNSKLLVACVAVGLESAVDVTGLCIAIANPEYGALIGGAVIRLAATAILATLAMRGRNWAGLVLVGIEAFTALFGVFFLCIVMTNPSVARATGLAIASCVATFYGLLAVAFWVGLRPGRGVTVRE